ncbi:MAG: HypC/HybG/HupF family hydrogenase formation chaperone, partial [Candidatus Omnitrophota bacterium]
MCWSVPGKITGIDGNMATVEIGGILRSVALDLIDGAAIGEYVLVHAGYAIQKVEEDRAKFTIDFLKG